MSNLTLALAIFGGLVLAAVVGYEAMMSRRNAPRQPDAVDVALDEVARAVDGIGKGLGLDHEL